MHRGGWGWTMSNELGLPLSASKSHNVYFNLYCTCKPPPCQLLKCTKLYEMLYQSLPVRWHFKQGLWFQCGTVGSIHCFQWQSCKFARSIQYGPWVSLPPWEFGKLDSFVHKQAYFQLYHGHKFIQRDSQKQLLHGILSQEGCYQRDQESWTLFPIEQLWRSLFPIQK